MEVVHTMLILTVYVLFICTQLVISDEISFDREVSTQALHPPHSYNGSYLNMYHTTARGPNDTLHYIVGTYGFPSILVALTDNSARLHIEWEKLLNNTEVGESVSFSPEPQYVYGLQFLQLIEYNDIHDTADMLTTTDMRRYSLGAGVPWANSSQLQDGNVIIFSIDENYTDPRTGVKVEFMPGGSFSIKMKMNNMTIRSSDLPHLHLTGNTSLVDVTIDHMEPHYDNTRYAIELVYLDNSGSSTELDSYESIDDEHTPGVFQILDMGTKSHTLSSYIQWKPVCYKSASRSMKTATKIRNYNMTSSDLVRPQLQGEYSLLYAYFGDLMYQEASFTAMNISFGLSGDKFYKDTYYTSWSFTMGYGAAPVESISTLIIIIISVGLGIPVLLLVLGGISACIHKKKKTDDSSMHDSSMYQAIN